LLVLVPFAALAAAPGSAPWPAWGHDQQRTRRSQFVGPRVEPRIRWERQVPIYLNTMIAVKQGLVGLLENSEAWPDLASMELLSFGGEERWTWSQSVGDRHLWRNTPALAGTGALMVLGTRDIPGSEQRERCLVSITILGTLAWELCGPSLENSGTFPIGLQDQIYVPVRDGNRHWTAYSPDGTLLWDNPAFFFTGIGAGPPTIGHDGTFYQFSGYDVYAHDEDGDFLWASYPDIQGDIKGVVVADDGTLLVEAALYQLPYPTLYQVAAMAPDGTPLWVVRDARQVTLGADGMFFTTREAEERPCPNSAGGVGGWIQARRVEDGSLIWERLIQSVFGAWYVTVDREGNVYTAQPPGGTGFEPPCTACLSAWDKDGNELWWFDGEHCSTPKNDIIIGSDGTLYVLYSGRILALEDPSRSRQRRIEVEPLPSAK
jgi:hypothetical protein